MLLSLLTLGGAIASFRIARRIQDEIVKIVSGLIGLGCLMASLILAPWIFKLVVVVSLITLPNLYGKTNHTVVCPKHCAAKGRCHTPMSQCFGWMRQHLHHYHWKSKRSEAE